MTTSPMEWPEIKEETLDLVVAGIICQEAGLTIRNLTLTKMITETTILVGSSRMEIRITEEETTRTMITGRAQCGKISDTTIASTIVTIGAGNLLKDSTDRMGRTDDRCNTVSLDTEINMPEQRTECSRCQTLSEITCNNLFLSVCL